MTSVDEIVKEVLNDNVDHIVENYVSDLDTMIKPIMVDSINNLVQERIDNTFSEELGDWLNENIEFDDETLVEAMLEAVKQQNKGLTDRVHVLERDIQTLRSQLGEVVTNVTKLANLLKDMNKKPKTWWQWLCTNW